MTGTKRIMKKAVCVLLCAGMMAVTAGCGNNPDGAGAANRSAGKTAGVEEVLQAGIEKNNAGGAENPDGTEQTTGGESASRAEDTGKAADITAAKTDPALTPDVDLTKLSSTMVYSEVFNMMSKPDDYLGKTVKMDGQYTVYHDDITGADYYACIIQDATACCAQGIEFILKEDYAYPDDYPQEGEEIVVVGVYDTYMEGEYQYCTLRDAVLVD